MCMDDSAAVCAKGFCAKERSAAVCAEGFWVNKKICSCVHRDLQLSAQLEELKGSTVECAD